MDIIAVGSMNPVKVQAVGHVFKQQNGNSVQGIEADSGVRAQPFSDRETKAGAVHRAHTCLRHEDVTLGIGLEGGVVESEEGMLSVNWGALIDRAGRKVIASGARYPLPEEIAEGLRGGKELGEVIDTFTARHHVRKSEGAVGIFTNGLMTRNELYVHLVQLLAGQYKYIKQSENGAEGYG